MNNYYEILEVSKNASKEVIEKAYKVLVKKYHPDLQKEENKAKAEQKMKLINEAYEVLSDDIRKKEYDIRLEELLKIQMQEELNKINQEKLRNQQNSNYNNYTYSKEEQRNNTNNYYYEKEKQNNNANNNYYEKEEPLTKEEIKKQIKEEKKARRLYQEERERTYRNYMRSLGYRVKERWTFRKTIKLLEILGIIIIIFTVLWFFPPTHKILVETYENNKIIKIIIDIITKIIVGLAQGIDGFFRTIFIKK